MKLYDIVVLLSNLSREVDKEVDKYISKGYVYLCKTYVNTTHIDFLTNRTYIVVLIKEVDK